MILKLSASGSLISKYIQFRTSSIYSHVDIVLPEGGYLGSLPGKGVIIHNNREILEHFYEVVLDPLQEMLVYDFLEDQLDKPYDYSGILGWMSHRNWQEDDRWFCSELVAAALNMSDKLFPSAPYWITPANIAEHPRIIRVH